MLPQCTSRCQKKQCRNQQCCEQQRCEKLNHKKLSRRSRLDKHKPHDNRWYAVHDAGSGTIQAAALVCCIGVVLTICLTLGAILLAKAKAQTASDSAALVAAQAWYEGDADPCEQARRASSANDAVLVSCSIEKDDIMVTAEVAVSIPLLPSITYESRAGPQEC